MTCYLRVIYMLFIDQMVYVFKYTKHPYGRNSSTNIVYEEEQQICGNFTPKTIFYLLLQGKHHCLTK